jgi:adenylosuccinate synthase
MANYIVMGAQWGDEGKGKIVDYLADDINLVIRFQGGANAGHTIVRDGTEFILHLIPGGIITGKCKNIIGNGCVVDLELLIEEMETLGKMGISITPKNFFISEQAHIVTPVHKYIDKVLNEHIGTTGRGIGPCYVDKIQRTGIRIENLFDNSIRQRFIEQFEFAKKFTADNRIEDYINKNDYLEKLKYIQTKLRPFVSDSVEIISAAIKRGENILYEGAQGTMLDIDHGTYPFVTSSNTTIGGAYTGGGVFLEFDKRIGIVKAYTTRVGEGPFPTELKNEIGERLRENGHEYGATTGRPRRGGWLDLHLLKRSFIINGFNYIVLTKLDCLTGFEKIKAAVKYNGKNEPVYREFPGWTEDIVGITRYDELPENCRKYIEFLEEYVKTPIGLISTGSDRKQVIFRERL